MNSVKILYEDSRSGATKGFALHDLVRAGVAAHLKEKLEDVDLDTAHPCRGNANVLREVRKNLDKLARRGRMVIAVLDGDQTYALLQLPHGSCRAEMRSKIVSEWAHGSDRLGLVFIPTNLESLLTDLRGIAPSALEPDKRWDAALAKDTNERDAAFRRACYLPGVPERLIELPAWEYLIRRVSRAVREGK